MGARWYDSVLGAWISADTLVPDPENPVAFNRYAYAAGNSLRYVDPSGHIYFDYEKGVVVWNGIPWLEASQNAPEGFDLGVYPDPDPGIQATPNRDKDGTLADDGSYVVTSPDNPTFIYPLEVEGTADVVRSEIGGYYLTPAPSRERAASSVVWIMRNMVEKGRPWKGGKGKTEYDEYSDTWSQFARPKEGFREDENVALRVFLGQLPDPTGGGVYMINKAAYEGNPQLHLRQRSQVEWYTAGSRARRMQVGHYFFSFCPLCD
jgi:hypothetical protein